MSANEPQLDSLLKLGVSPEKAPNEPKYITIGFEKGEPVSLDGKKLDPRPLVEELNKLGGAYGVGIADIVEDRLVGMKSRAFIPSSKRTWSLPLPVAPWHIATAPSL